MWGEEIHVIFNHDPGPVRFETGSDRESVDLVGSDTLRAFVVLHPHTTLFWGEASRYIIEYDRVVVPDTAPTMQEVVPDAYDGPLAADDLNADGLRIVFGQPIDNVGRLIPLWEVALALVIQPDGTTWTPRYTVDGDAVTILPPEGETFRSQSNYTVVVIADRFGGGQSTEVNVPVSVE